MIAISIAFVGFAQNRVVVSHNFKALNIENVKSVQGVATGNLDFENWNSDMSGYGLGEWANGYSLLTGNPGAQKNATAQTGSFAMHIESNVVTNAVLQWDDTLVSGIAFAGPDALLGGAFGEEYTDNVNTCTGFIKGLLLANDTAMIIIQLRNADSVLASGMIAFGAADLSVGNYAEFTFPIVSAGPSTLVHDSIDIIISSSGHGVFSTNVGTLTAGSYIDVDNMALTFTTDIVNVNTLKETNIYPNPTNNVLNINTDANSEIIIYNLLGKEVYSLKNSQINNTINVSEFIEGAYIVKVINDNNTYTKKISIIK